MDNLELAEEAAFKCPLCGTYGLTQIECSGFGGDPGDDSKAHAPTKMQPNPDRSS